LLYFILIVLFALVFAYLGWRILMTSGSAPPPTDAFVCPHCNRKDCICHKKTD
jgi:hypothetical protein